MSIHTCSYSCERPACIKAQRDELAQRFDELAQRFLELVAEAVAAEREACAELCQEMEDQENPYERNVAVLDCASAIRARGDKA